MKLATLLFFVVFSTTAKSQLTFNDLYRMATSFNNPYVVNQRSYRDAIDSLHLRGYILSEYTRVPAVAPVTGRTDAFTLDNAGSTSESLRIVSVLSRVNNVNTIMYTVNLTTNDLVQYTQMLQLVRGHPDFVRTVNAEINFSDAYTARPGVGEKQQITFTIMSTGSTQTGIKATRPFTYQITILRMQP